MRLLLFLLLQASLVHQSLQEDPDPFAELKYGFPAGSLLTVYLKYQPTTNEVSIPKGLEKEISIDLYEVFSLGRGRLHFRLNQNAKNRDSTFVVSNVPIGSKNNFSKDNEQNFTSFATPTPEYWWRFDLYKINDTAFIPFLQGFNAKLRIMQGVKDSTYLHINSHNTSNFNKSDVYMWHRYPPQDKNKRSTTSKPETVLAALNEDEVHSKPATDTWTFSGGFPDKKKIKLSVLMICRHWDKNNVTNQKDASQRTIFFASKNSDGYFGIRNFWNVTENMLNLRLFGKGGQIADCTGVAPNRTTSTDIVHFKLQRNITKIQMRVFWKQGSAAGITCEIDMGKTGAVFLDGELMVFGSNNAAILHISDFF